MSWQAMRLTVLFGVVAMAGLLGCDNSDTPSTVVPSTEISGDSKLTEPETEQKADAPSWQEKFDKSLASNKTVDRYQALVMLNDAEVDHGTRVSSMVSAMEREIKSPSEGPLPVEGASLPSNEFLKLRLTRNLSKLASSEELAEIARNQSGEVRERAILAQGSAGNHEAIPELEKLLQQSSSGWIRADAAFLLGELHSEASVPLLKKALDDQFRIQADHYSRKYFEYHVRIYANSALKKLGVKLEAEPVLFEPADKAAVQEN